jgi:AAA ATPase domain
VKQQCLYRLERREAIRQALVACRDCSWRYRAFVECRCSLTEQNACSVWAWSPALDGSFRTAHHGCAMAVLPLVGHERELGTLDDLVDRVGERGEALVVCGEAGIGKSALLGAVRTRSRAKVA